MEKHTFLHRQAGVVKQATVTAVCLYETKIMMRHLEIA